MEDPNDTEITEIKSDASLEDKEPELFSRVTELSEQTEE